MFGERLTQLRRRRGLTQAQLARLAGLTQQGICLLEQGKRRPLLETCQKLANALEVDPVELLKEPTANAA